MSFINAVFGGREAHSAALIDIGANSIGAAYALIPAEKPASLLYHKRALVVRHPGESDTKAMLRTLKFLAEALVREGGHALVRATGRGRSHTFLVAIGAPWQQVSLYSRKREERHPFVFSQEWAETFLAADAPVPEGAIPIDTSIINVLLNGYEIQQPYGKSAALVSVSALGSAVETDTLEQIDTVLAQSFHTRTLTRIAASSLHYQAFFIAFPHERDALVMDVSGAQTSLFLKRQGLLAAYLDFMSPEGDEQAWRDGLYNHCAELSKLAPLPQPVFILAPDADIEILKRMLDDDAFKRLWLDGRSPKLVPITAGHLNGLVSGAAEVADVPLLLMALYRQHALGYGS